MFSHAYFKGVSFYAARWYVHLKKNVREEDFFVSYEEEEDYEVLPVSELTLLEEQRVCGVEISYLPYLASGHNLNLTSEYRADLWRQVITINDNNNPSPENINVPKTNSLPKLWEDNSCKLEEIISQGDQAIYTTTMLISRIIIVIRWWIWKRWSCFNFISCLISKIDHHLRNE